MEGLLDIILVEGYSPNEVFTEECIREIKSYFTSNPINNFYQENLINLVAFNYKKTKHLLSKTSKTNAKDIQDKYLDIAKHLERALKVFELLPSEEQTSTLSGRAILTGNRNIEKELRDIISHCKQYVKIHKMNNKQGNYYSFIERVFALFSQTYIYVPDRFRGDYKLYKPCLVALCSIVIDIEVKGLEVVDSYDSRTVRRYFENLEPLIFSDVEHLFTNPWAQQAILSMIVPYPENS